MRGGTRLRLAVAAAALAAAIVWVVAGEASLPAAVGASAIAEQEAGAGLGHAQASGQQPQIAGGERALEAAGSAPEGEILSPEAVRALAASGARRTAEARQAAPGGMAPRILGEIALTRQLSQAGSDPAGARATGPFVGEVALTRQLSHAASGFSPFVGEIALTRQASLAPAGAATEPVIYRGFIGEVATVHQLR